MGIPCDWCALTHCVTLLAIQVVQEGHVVTKAVVRFVPGVQVRETVGTLEVFQL